MTAQGKVSYGLIDYSNEKTSFAINIPELVAANIAAQLILIGTFRAALGNIILGTVGQETVTARANSLSNVLPTDVNAQRERKWLVVYQDVTQYLDAPTNTINNTGYHKKFTAEIGTADLSLLVGHTDTVSVDDPSLPAELDTFRDAWNALALSPYGGATAVLSFVAAGRNL
jgi:hypothetical protein